VSIERDGLDWKERASPRDKHLEWAYTVRDLPLDRRKETTMARLRKDSTGSIGVRSAPSTVQDSAPVTGITSR
jgi:hypothetical protein